MRFAKVATFGIVALLVVACGGITIPTIPAIPSFPPIGLPSGGSFPPGVIPSVSGTCALISPDEIGAAMGSVGTLTSVSASDCSYTFSNFATVNITIEASTDLQGVHVFLGTSAKDITVAGLPAVSGVFFGQSAVYVQKGANQLQVLGILTGSDDATIAKLVQVASVAAARMP
ncbi:MAG: hypothetical protein ABI744_03110 [Chloroflexota bacterium]